MNGKILIFEGLDKTGKTTQINIISNYLKKMGIKNIVTREPGGTEIGKLIRDILLYKGSDLCYLSEYFLFVADRFEHIISKILFYYKKGFWVLIDRFHFSSFSYQIYPYIEKDRELIDIDKLIGKKIFSIINPDLIFYFTKRIYSENKNSISMKNINESKNNKLLNKDKIEKRDKDYFARVMEGYELSFKHYKNFENIVKKIYFEDGISLNSEKIIRYIKNI